MNSKIKTACAVLLSALLALQLFACVPESEQDDGNEPSAEVAEVSEHPLETVEPENGYTKASFAFVGSYENIYLGVNRPAKLKMGYKSLQTQNQRSFYENLAAGAFYVSKETNKNGYHYIKQISVSNCTLSEAELRLIITAFIEDFPQVFWIADIFGYTNSGMQTVLQLYSKYGVTEIKSKISEINSVIGDFAGQIDEGMDDYERETAIHSLLLENCRYAENVTQIDDDFDAFGIYGALVNKSAVCEGYSRTLQWLLSLGGIECVNIVGNEEDVLHMWNAVKLDGSWYYVDPTWNDSGSYSRYDYYNITTDELLSDGHTIAPLYSQLTEEQICGTDEDKPISFNLFVPECSSYENSYLERGAVTLSEFNDYGTNVIVQKLYKALKNGEPFIEIVIDVPNMSYSEAVDKLTNENDGLIFDYINYVNNMFFGRQIDDSRVSVICKENRKILTVILRYK